MADSPAEDILDALVDQAKNQLSFSGVTGAPSIPDSHVQMATVPYTRDERQRFAATIPRPALVFSTARSVGLDPAAVDNHRYVAMYTFLAQFLHTELDQQVSAITRSIQKWEYTLRNYLHMGNLRQAADDTNWKITLVSVSNVDLRDERLFAVFDDSVAVIPFQVKSTEQHSSDGRT